MTYQPNAPSAASSLQRKYDYLGPQLGQVPDPRAARALTLYDLTRASRGQSPLTWRGQNGQLGPTSQTALALRAALTGQPQASPEPGLTDLITGLPGALLSDVRATAQAVPRFFIPNRGNPLYQEAQAVTQLPEHLANVTGPADLLTLPGVRFLPGTYTAANILGATDVQTGQQGSLAELLKHPGFTALDVAPYASKLAAGTSTVKAARSAYEAQFRQLTQSARPGLAPIHRPPRPLPTIMTQRRLRAGETGTTRVGGQPYEVPVGEPGVAPRLPTRAARGALEAVDPSGVLRATFSGRARQITRQFGFASHQTAELLSGQGVDDFINHYRGTSDTAEQAGGIARLQAEMTSMLPDSLRNDEARRVAVTQALETGDDTALRGLNLDDAELASVEQVKMLTDDISEWARREGQLKQAQRTQFGTSGWQEPQTAEALKLVAGEDYHPYVFRQIERQYSNARKASDRVTRAGQLAGQADQLVESLRPVSEAVSSIARKGDKMADRIVRAVRKPTPESLSNARGVLGEIRKQLKAVDEGRQATSRWSGVIDLPTVERAFTDIKEAGKAARARARITTTERAALSAERKLRQLTERKAPERYRPLLERQMAERARTAVSQGADIPIPVDDALRLIAEGSIGKVGFDDATIRYIQDIGTTWQHLKSKGIEPTFMSRAQPRPPTKLAYPRASTRAPSPTFVKARVADFTPHRSDVFVTLPEQTAQILGTYINKELATAMREFDGTPAGKIEAQYIARARGRGVPDAQVNAAAQSAMQREWVPWKPEAILPERATIKPWEADSAEYLIPRDVAKVIDQLQDAPGESFARLMDPVMKVFRTSVLALSPRWHANNLVGGNLMLLARTGPGVYKYATQAREMMRAARKGERALPEGFPAGGHVSVPDFDQWARDASARDKVMATSNYLAGSKMQTMLNDYITKHPGMERFGKKINSAVEWSYELNSMVDDMSRAMAYLYGYDKALKRGLGEPEAVARGIALTRKVMQEWDAMTPLERQVIRSVMPFYGWANHIVRYVYNMPFDHPWRTSITASLARAEFTDRAVGEDFRNLLTYGDMDEWGNQSAVRTRGMNPFADVANYFTLGGLVGQTNPVISSLLQSLGVDPISGHADLYPAVSYDPKTGRLTADTPNFFRTLVGSTVPQFRLIDQLGFDRAGWQELVNRDPEAAQRFLLSSTGMPIVTQTANVYTERMKAELARVEAMDVARREAVKRGDWGALEKYPVLRSYAQQLRSLEATGELEAFEPDPASMPSTSVRDVVTGAAGRQARDAYEEQVRALTSVQ